MKNKNKPFRITQEQKAVLREILIDAVNKVNEDYDNRLKESRKAAMEKMLKKFDDDNIEI